MKSTSGTTTAATSINVTITPTITPVFSVPPPTGHRDWTTGVVDLQYYVIPGYTVMKDDDFVPLLLEASIITWYVVD